MEILYLWDGDYPWDIRVEKVCNALLEQGHTIHLVCRNTKRQPRYECYKGLHLHRIAALPRVFGKLNLAFTFPAFFSPVWLWELYKQAKRNSCDLFFIRDLPMAFAGIVIAKLLRIRTVFDMAECYPEMLRCIRQYEGFELKNIFLRNPGIADWVEKMALRRFDDILVMIEESRDRLIEKHVDPNKIHIVSNTPVSDRFQTSKTPEQTTSERNILRLTYVGLLNPSRGIDTLLHAVDKYVKHNPDFLLTIAGSGKARKELYEIVQARQLGQYVEFIGWIDNTKVPELIANTDIGIVPHHKCSHWDNTIPNKLFDYMASGKPVIVSNVRPMERIVTTEECGLVYRDFDPDDLMNTLMRLEDPDYRTRLGANGFQAVQEKYNWNKEKKKLYFVVDNNCLCN